MFELLEEKETIKIVMLLTIQRECKQFADAAFFHEHTAKMLDSLGVSSKSQRSFERYIKEIEEDILFYNLESKIPLKFVGNEIVNDLSLPLHISYLMDRYLLGSIKFLLVYAAFRGKTMPSFEMMDWLTENIQPSPSSNREFSISPNTLRKKRDELNESFKPLGFSINKKYVFEGEEKSIRIFLFVQYLRNFNALTELETSLQDKRFKRFYYQVNEHAKIIMSELKDDLAYQSIKWEQFLMILIGVTTIRNLNENFLSKTKLKYYNNTALIKDTRLANIISIFQKELSKKIAPEQLKVETFFIINFLYVFDFPFTASFDDFFSTRLKADLDSTKSIIMSLFEDKFKQPFKHEDKLLFSKNFHKVLLQLLFFENYDTGMKSNLEYFKHHYPIVTPIILSSTKSLSEHFPKLNRLIFNGKASCSLFNNYFSQLIHPAILTFYNNSSYNEDIINNYIVKANICIEVFGGIAKKQFIEQALMQKFNLRANFQDFPDETTNFYITDIIASNEKAINASIFEWRIGTSDPMLENFANTVKNWQFEHL
ncbi:hypothetical protein SAMN02745116_01479 [Pilibacter termitis]|uniref:Mga helix-turn-helix domain-containing protein n=1 Tax=Pilibacter termitis TaxID=263852 RepID=A0A1T4NM60_9ENTE|nr:hypothetical protein [Pilibacter termitis]SJZ80243.1 hypothetical protein SAMN02745116_01479 [Pilibacter termitis]